MISNFVFIIIIIISISIISIIIISSTSSSIPCIYIVVRNVFWTFIELLFVYEISL